MHARDVLSDVLRTWLRSHSFLGLSAPTVTFNHRLRPSRFLALAMSGGHGCSVRRRYVRPEVLALAHSRVVIYPNIVP